jgi:hypothetical protein
MWWLLERLSWMSVGGLLGYKRLDQELHTHDDDRE